MATLPALPMIDMTAFRAGDPDARSNARSAISAEIRRNSRELGFFYLIGHGVPEVLLDAQLAWARRFFALPVAEKAAIDFRKLPVRRGYEPLAQQTLQAGARPDRKEVFCYGSEPGAGPPSRFEGPNQWPASGPDFDGEGFRAQMLAYQAAMNELGRQVCSLLASSLELAEDYFTAALSRPSTDIRLLHYPGRASGHAAADDVLGAGAHTDWGLITLLLQDDCGGLEVQTPQGWLEAEPMVGAFIVNLGDMVVRLTAGRYASNVHRVRDTPPGRDRCSVATFFNPHASHVVECAPTCRPEHGPAPEPVTFADHILDMVRKTYAA